MSETEVEASEHGDVLITLAWAGTAIFVVTAAASVVTESMRAVGVAVALILFALGTIAFLLAYARSIDRSRTEELSVAGIYFLAGGCAPTRVRLHLMGALGVQVVVAFATASLRPFTALAFGILVPMYGLGLNGLWAARYGRFAERAELDHKRPRKRRSANSKPTARPSEGEQVR